MRNNPFLYLNKKDTPRISFSIKEFGVYFMKKQSKWRSFVLHAVLGGGVSCLLLFVLLLIIALISSNGGLSDTICMISAYGAAILSWAAGGFIAGFRNRRDGLLIGVVIAVTMLLLILFTSLIVKGGKIEIFSLKFLLYLLGGSISCSIGSILGVHIALKNR